MSAYEQPRRFASASAAARPLAVHFGSRTAGACSRDESNGATIRPARQRLARRRSALNVWRRLSGGSSWMRRALQITVYPASSSAARSAGVATTPPRGSRAERHDPPPSIASGDERAVRGARRQRRGETPQIVQALRASRRCLDATRRAATETIGAGRFGRTKRRTERAARRDAVERLRADGADLNASIGPACLSPRSAHDTGRSRARGADGSADRRRATR